MKIKQKSDKWVSIIAGAILVGILGAIFAIYYFAQNYAPCWLYSVKDAPVRCVNR